MKMKINLDSLKTQYFIGLIINLFFLIILISANITFQNLQLPENDFKDNLWQDSDVMSYVRPARNFLENNVFGEDKIPSMHRTIGYPLFISFVMKIFGNKWLISLQIIQALIFAFIYPALSKIAFIVFPRKKFLAKYIFFFSIISLTYISRVAILYNDLFFTVFFTIGLCFGLMSIVKRSWKYMFLHIIFIGYASQIRPILILYPFINILIMLSMIKRYKLIFDRKFKKLLLYSTSALLIVCNGPSIRNYLNHKIFKPTFVLETNLFNYFGKDILESEGNTKLYNSMRNDIAELETNYEKANAKKRYALTIFKKYPLTAIKLISFKYTMNILSKTHWLPAIHYWGYHWRNTSIEGKMPMKKSSIAYFITIVSFLLYNILYLFFLLFLIRLIRLKLYLYFVTLSVFILYFFVPPLLGGACSRMRLPIEGIIVIFSLYEIYKRKYIWSALNRLIYKN